MSLPVTSLCSNSSVGSLYAVSGSTIYQGSTPVATLDHTGIKSSVSCASFWSPYLVVCAGQTISVYKCIANSLSLCYLILCPTVVLSMLPSDTVWLLSFITGDWGYLDVYTGTLTSHKGSTGVFFSSHFLGFLCNKKALLALGSAAPLIELCLIDVEKTSYTQIAIVSTISFPVLCIRSHRLPSTEHSSAPLFFLLALSCKHAHVFSLALSATNESGITMHATGWPVLDSTSRLYSGCLDSTSIYLGDELGNIRRYVYSYQHDSGLLTAFDYCVSVHSGIVKDMLMLDNKLYTCGEDGAVLLHDIEKYPHKSNTPTIECICSEIANASRKKGSIYLHSSMIYTANTRCIVIYTCDNIIISNFISVLTAPLPGQKPNSFDELVTEDGDIVITIGYTISAIYCIGVSLSPFEISKIDIIDVASKFQKRGAINRKIPNNLGISSCHLLHQTINAIYFFAFVHGIGGILISCKRDMSTVVSISLYQYASSNNCVTIINVETGVSSSQKTNQQDLKALGPLTSSIIRSFDGSSLIFVYTKDRQLQVFKYLQGNLYLLFPILTLCASDNGKMKLYTRSCSPLSHYNHNHDEHNISALFISHSGKIQLIQISIYNNQIALCQQNSTRSILPCNSFLLNWEKCIVIASRDAKSWIITSLHPDSFTYSQSTVPTSNLLEGHKETGYTLGVCYDSVDKQCFLFYWLFPKLLVHPVETPVLTAKVIRPGWVSGSEINALVIMQNMLICGSETGEVTLHDIDMNFIRVINYCNASVRSISAFNISSTENLIVIGSSNSQLVCLVWNIESATVTGCARFPIRYTQPRTSELDVRYTYILPFSDLSLGSQIALFLVGVSIGELWLMCFVHGTRCIYLIERCPIHSVPVQLQWMRLGQEHYVVGAMTQGLVVVAVDKTKTLAVLSKASCFDQMNIGYTEHVLSHKPLGSVCGVDGIITTKWQMKSSSCGSITSILVFEHYTLALSDIGYLTLYTFKECREGIQLVKESSLQNGCTNGVICATSLPSPEEDVSFVYVGWDRVPHYCMVGGVSTGTTVMHSCSLPSIPLYNIHSVLCSHASSEENTLIFCGSGLFTMSVPKKNMLMSGSFDELTKISKS